MNTCFDWLNDILANSVSMDRPIRKGAGENNRDAFYYRILNDRSLRPWIARRYKWVLKLMGPSVERANVIASGRKSVTLEKGTKKSNKNSSVVLLDKRKEKKKMKRLLGCCLLLCLLFVRAQTKPQITKLFPIEELPSNEHQETSTESKPLDKLIGKLRDTYNFVFHKADNTSNVEKILAKNSANPDVETFKPWNFWKNPTKSSVESEGNIDSLQNAKQREYQTKLKTLYEAPKYDLYEEFQPLEHAESLPPLEFTDKIEGKSDDVEFVTEGSFLQLPTNLRRHFVEWLGSLLGLTYGIYAKLTSAIHTSNYTLH